MPATERLFTFGSLMDPATMHQVCPKAEDLGPAVLEGYRFAITGFSEHYDGGVADVVASQGDRVEGVLWALPEADLETLDKYEGVPEGFYRRERGTVRWRGKDVEAWFYTVVDKDEEVEPSARFMTVVLRGARRHALSEGYVEFLEDVADASK